MLMITLGTGIGAGLIINGQIFRGAAGFAGEFGHMTIDPEGIECGCGNVGCLETIASGPNIVRRTRERLYRDRTSSLSRLAIPRDREFTAEDIARARTYPWFVTSEEPELRDAVMAAAALPTAMT